MVPSNFRLVVARLSTTFVMHSGIQRALQQRRSDSIYMVLGPVFNKANNICEAKCSLYWNNGKLKHKRKPEITQGDLQKM